MPAAFLNDAGDVEGVVEAAVVLAFEVESQGVEGPIEAELFCGSHVARKGGF
jgi:hypothetical protein